jgi:hypothetical protein
MQYRQTCSGLWIDRDRDPAGFIWLRWARHQVDYATQHQLRALNQARRVRHRKRSRDGRRTGRLAQLGRNSGNPTVLRVLHPARAPVTAHGHRRIRVMLFLRRLSYLMDRKPLKQSTRPFLILRQRVSKVNQILILLLHQPILQRGLIIQKDR